MIICYKKHAILLLLFAIYLFLTISSFAAESSVQTSNFIKANGVGKELKVRGQLRPKQFAILASGISAKLNSFSVKPGELLKKGQEIAIFECDYERAAETIVLAKLAAAQAKLEVNIRLLKLHNVSGLEVRLSRAEVEINQGEVRKIKAILKECTLSAPFSGIVTGKFVQTHQYVNKGDPLLELVNNKDLEVEMVIPSSWLMVIKNNVPFSIHLEETGLTLQGIIDRIIGNIDPVSQTVHVVGTLDDSSASLLPGMSGMVRFNQKPSAEQ